MEHRWGQRVPVAIEVRLACHPYAIGSGCIRDASMSGAFVSTALELPLLSLVRVDIMARSGNGRAQLRRFVAHVVRRDAAGVGVEWQTLDPAVLRELLVCASRHEAAGTRAARHRGCLGALQGDSR